MKQGNEDVWRMSWETYYLKLINEKLERIADALEKQHES